MHVEKKKILYLFKHQHASAIYHQLNQPICQSLIEEMQKNATFSCFLIYIIIHMGIINAIHFEGGTITSKVLNISGSIVSIVLILTYIYDYTALLV